MTCCSRQSYIVNRSNKKDNSFKLFITFLLAVLIVYLVIYALIVTLTKTKDDEREENQESSTKPIESSTIFYLLYQKGNKPTDSTKFIETTNQIYTTKTKNTEDFTEATTENSIQTETATTVIENKSTIINDAVFTSTQNKEENSISTIEKIIIESTLAATIALVPATDKAIVANTEQEILCQSPYCKKMAIDIMKNIDFSIDPCEDFYQFSCGNDVTTSVDDYAVLFEEIKNNSTNDDGLKSFGQFVNSCQVYRDEYGSFDILKQVSSINIRSSNLTTLLGFLLLRQSTPLFEIAEGRDGEIQILPPSSYDTDVLENWSLKTHIHKHCSTLQKLEDYKQCQSKTLHKMLKNLHSFKISEKNNSDFDFLLNNIKQQIPLIDIQEALLKKSCQKIDIMQLNNDYPVINWQVLLNTITETSKPMCIYFKSDYFDPIMTDLDARISKNESEVLNAIKEYFQLQIYENLMSQLNDNFCMKQAVNLMPEIAEKILRQKVFNELQQFEVMFREVKDKFYWLIEVSKLKEDDKNLFKNKLKLLKIEFNDKLANKIVDYHAYNTDDYLSKLFGLLEDRRMIHEEKSVILSEKMELINDTIVIPYSFVYKTTIKKRRPDFYIKFHMSRAIAGYFNQMARDVKNSFYEEFQKSLNTNLENKLENKLREQWSTLVRVTTFERTADNLTLQVAFESNFPQNSTRKLPWISEAYSDEQQFYLMIVQDICESSLPQSQIVEETKNLPPKFRIEAMLTNSNNFAKSFKCPEGSTMNPADEKIEFDQFEFDEEYEAGDQVY